MAFKFGEKHEWELPHLRESLQVPVSNFPESPLTARKYVYSFVTTGTVPNGYIGCRR